MTENKSQTVGRNVKRLRTARRWSQVDLARELGKNGLAMHQTTIAKLEAGKRPTTANEVATLAWVFRVGLLDILTDGEVDAEFQAEMAAVDERARRLALDASRGWRDAYEKGYVAGWDASRSAQREGEADATDQNDQA